MPQINRLSFEITKQPKKFFENFPLFQFFLNIFYEIMLKNNFCVNLITETSKYHWLEKSSTELGCTAFEPSFKKSKHI
jgi:hypothetical protein